jgi:glycosyltransferase involved in cell wall biosynthesis
MSTEAASHPLVSVTMPAYNYGKYVEQAVRSAWEQDYPNLELICVDDGSTDDTLTVLQRLMSESPFPMRVLRGKHKGVCAALNLALEEVCGEYVSMLHADDWYREDKVSKQVQVARRDSRISLVHSEYLSVDAAGVPNGTGSWLDLPPASGNALRSLLELRSDVRSPTLLMPTAALLEVGRYDETLPVEDHQSILRLAKHGLVAHVPEPLVFRRVHATNVSHNTGKGRSLRFEEFAYNIICEVIPPDMPFDEVCATHAGVTLSNAIAQGGWEKARHGFGVCWKEFPRGRRALIRAAMSGTRSFVWMHWLMPYLPADAIKAIRRLKGRPARTSVAA